MEISGVRKGGRDRGTGGRRERERERERWGARGGGCRQEGRQTGKCKGLAKVYTCKELAKVYTCKELAKVSACKGLTIVFTLKS